MKKVWINVNGVKVDCEVVKEEYKYKGETYLRAKVNGKVERFLVSEVEYVKRAKTLKKEIKGHIEVAEKWDKKCLAEYFGLRQYGKTDFWKGQVCVEIKMRKETPIITIYRESRNDEFMTEEFTTKSWNECARYLEAINEYDCLDWDLMAEQITRFNPLAM